MKAIVSWGDLTVYLAVFLFLYYLVMLLIFFRREIRFRAIDGHNVPQPGAAAAQRVDLSPTPRMTAPQDDVVYHQVMELMEDLKPVLKLAIDERQHTDQILSAIKNRLQQYPAIKGSAFRAAVSNHIEQSLQLSTGVLLSAEDINSVW